MRLRVVAAAAAVVADPNADVLDLGGLDLLDLVASVTGEQRVKTKLEVDEKQTIWKANPIISGKSHHQTTNRARSIAANAPPRQSHAESSPQNLAGGALGLLKL
jgi:hypothetical protein